MFCGRGQLVLEQGTPSSSVIVRGIDDCWFQQATGDAELAFIEFVTAL